MLNLTTALGRNGLQDWILQRVSAIILAIYAIFLLTFWLYTGNSVTPWQTLFSIGMVRFATVIALLALMVHAWIGVWVVLTDYIKPAGLRLALLTGTYCWLLFNLIWCMQILWGF